MRSRETLSLYGKLFLSTFVISAVTFGGGYVIISIMKKKYVEELKWLEDKEMLEMTALAQACPGIITVNTSILVGHRMAGVPGALLTMLGAVTPPFLALMIISLFYAAFREQYLVGRFLWGMQAGAAALLADVVFSMCKNVLSQKSWADNIVLAASFAAVFFLKINAVWIILACAAFGLFFRRADPEKQKRSAAP
ncbi:MAG: chromate transporter [Clostridiales bacterium]|nr:chromate transporter [Clostridiales bacterium]